jgi:hypothetical protein
MTYPKLPDNFSNEGELPNNDLVMTNGEPIVEGICTFNADRGQAITYMLGLLKNWSSPSNGNQEAIHHLMGTLFRA